MIPKNEKSYFWGSCAKIKVLQLLCASKMTRGAVDAKMVENRPRL
jgi:hypothetical protein